MKKVSLLKTNQSPLLLCFALLLVACSRSTHESPENLLEEIENTQDTISTEAINILPITAPYPVSKIAQLEYTSGGGQAVEKNEFCDNIDKGFFGTYFLVDRDFTVATEQPIAGTITVHANGKMKDWKPEDSTQTIWEIHLKSAILSVWDSIHVGLPRTEIEHFGQQNQGLCVNQGDNIYACDFQTYKAVYLFKNDTVSELIVTKNCN